MLITVMPPKNASLWDLSDFVPEGLDDRSQAIYCLEHVPIENPSRRARSDPDPGFINRPNRRTPIGPNHTLPYGTVPVFARIPGNKLHGYDHLIPPHQSPTLSRFPIRHER